MPASSFPFWDAVNQARLLHRKGRYQLALEILETNMRAGVAAGALGSANANPEEIFALHELRADLYFKEKYYREAIEDAKIMIRIQGHNPRGYLRLGQIYQTVGRVADAAKVYSKALKKVSTRDEAYKMLLAHDRKAARKLRDLEKYRNDPLRALPTELVYHIFKKFTLAQLLSAAPVSRRWRDYIFQESRFWQRLDLDVRPASRMLRCTTFQDCVKRSGVSLSIDLHDTYLQRPDQAFDYIARNHAAKLHQLTASGRNLSAPSMTIFTPLRVAPQYPKLESLSIHTTSLDHDLAWCLEHMPALRSLELKATPRSRPRSLQHLPKNTSQSLQSVRLWGTGDQQSLLPDVVGEIAGLPGMKELHMHRVTDAFAHLAPALQSKTLENFGFTPSGRLTRSMTMDMPQFAGKLKHLTLNGIVLNVLHQPLQKLPLEYLELKWAGVPLGTIQDVVALFNCQSTLQTLVLHRVELHWNTTGSTLALPKLRTLQYTDMPKLDDRSLDWLLGAVEGLRFVNFDGTEMTGPNLLRFLEAGVQRLRCKGCSLSTDTLKWLDSARKQGVEVRY